jgi:mannose-6-phosphate isomerase-like protein (cupin superfamily)
LSRSGAALASGPEKNARVYVAAVLGCSTSAIEWLLDLLHHQGVQVEIVDVKHNPELWRDSGLRTVPAVELRYGESVVRSYAGDISEPVILEALRTMDEDAMPDEMLTSYRVVASTSCHRYGRWNEQALRAPSRANGWSSISRTRPGGEFLVFDFFRQWRVCGVELGHRDSTRCGDYRLSVPKSCSISVSSDARSWTTVLDADSWDSDEPNGANVANESTRWNFPPEDARFVRLDIHSTQMRPEGKYFAQLAGVTFWRRPDPERVGLFPAFDLDPDVTESDQPVKRGLMWSPSSSAERWWLRSGQALPWRVLPAGEAIWIVITGSVELAWTTKSSGELTSQLPAGATATVPPGTPFRLRATDDATLLSLTNGDDGEIWGPRPEPPRGLSDEPGFLGGPR